jgi:hypothetical protein
MTRVQFKELVEAVTRGDATDEKELAVVKSRIQDPASGVSFSPRKKPRFLDDSWEFADLEMLPAIEEGPEDIGGHRC